MSDTTQNPAEAAIEDLDVMAWLDDSTQPSESIEIYNKGTLLKDLIKLTGVVEQQKARIEDRSRDLTMDRSIADEEEETITEALDAIEALREELKGTGLTFFLQGLTSKEKEMIAATEARKLKGTPSSGTIGKDDWVPAVGSGEEHPDYNKNFNGTLIAKSIASVQNANGAVSTKKWTADQVEKLRVTLPGVEFRRLSNAVFDINYYSYEVDKLVDLDFS